jgi:hypothetical protein
VPEIERRRKRPLVIEMLLWDGTNFAQVDEFAGDDGCGYRNAAINSGILAVWNDQEQAWQVVPPGHRVVKSTLGEMYPMSPQAYEKTTEPTPGEDVLRSTRGVLYGAWTFTDPPSADPDRM